MFNAQTKIQRSVPANIVLQRVQRGKK